MSFLNTLPAGVWLAAFAGLVGLATLWLRRTLVFERRARRDAESSLERTGQLEALATALLKGYTSLEISEAALAELLPATGASTGAIALISEGSTDLAVLHTLGFADDRREPAVRPPRLADPADRCLAEERTSPVVVEVRSASLLPGSGGRSSL